MAIEEASTPIEYVTLGLVTDAAAALDRLMDATGLSRVDLVNRAIQVYEAIEVLRREVDGQMYVHGADGSIYRIDVYGAEGGWRATQV